MWDNSLRNELRRLQRGDEEEKSSNSGFVFEDIESHSDGENSDKEEYIAEESDEPNRVVEDRQSELSEVALYLEEQENRDDHSFDSHWSEFV